VTFVPESAARQDWPRLVAQAIKERQNPPIIKFKPLAVAPTSPKEGWTYYDSALHKLRVWDGSAWQNCW
jgi:hypothetical protein